MNGDRTNQTRRGLRVRFHPEAVRQLRAKQGLTANQLAAELKLGEATLGRIESGKGKFLLRTANAVCKYFNVGLESIADVIDDVPLESMKTTKQDGSQLFNDMMKELSSIIDEGEARNAMTELFWKMQRFPFGRDKRDELYKREKYDLDAFVTILEFRAGAILWTLQSISDGLIELREGERQEDIMPLEGAKKLAAEWKERFIELHETHVQAIRDGNLLLAHEIRHEIAELLTTIYWSYQKPFRFPRGIYSSH
jgi:transcriptional regulator with XRE-family HTH domain